MLTRAYPLIFRNRKRPARRPPPGTPPAPPVALVLVAATYETGAALTLTFDRAITIAGLDGSVILVRDQAEALLFDATGEPEMISPFEVRLALVPVEGDSTPGVTLTAGPTNGIVAVDDGGTWGGVADLELPFP